MLRHRPPAVQWAVLVVLSALLVALLEWLHLPAALLLGAMVAGIAVAAADAKVHVPAAPFVAAQAVVGCLIARSITPEILGTMLHDWPLFALGVVTVIGASALLGWGMARLGVLPGSTAVWGTSPGGASAMILMAEAFGADVRLVAFMQYLRVVCVSAVATGVSRVWTGASGGAAVPDWFPPIAWGPFGGTLALAALGAVVAPRLRIPAGPLLLPLFVGAALHGAGAMTIVLPPWLLAASYAVVGWTVGLRFTRAILVYALRRLPQVLAAIFVLIGLCGALAAVLVLAAGIDPLTAYLATSPGGADSVAIIAASSHVDLPFVMAMQTARFTVVLLLGPTLARFVARRAGTVEVHP